MSEKPEVIVDKLLETGAFNWKAAARQYGRGRPTRPAGFARLKDGTIVVAGYDVDVLMVLQGRDLEKLKTLLYEQRPR